MYIYDILLNFKNVNYDFFDWNNSDNITHIKKIPIIKIKPEDMKKIYNHNFSIDDLTSLSHKTEYYTYRQIGTIKAACIFTDGDIAFAVKFKNNKSYLRSNLLIDEEEEVLRISKKQPVKKIDFKVHEDISRPLFKTRTQLNNQNYLCRCINNLTDDELFYLYFDIFNKKEKNRKKVLNELKKAIVKNTNLHEKLNNFLKLLSI